MTYSASYNEASLRLRPLITCLKNLSETRAVICHESIDSDRQQAPHLILIVHNPNVHGDACPMARSYEPFGDRSEEHTTELQSRFALVCRLLLDNKKTI